MTDAVDYSKIFESRARVGIRTHGCFGSGDRIATVCPTGDQELDKKIITLVEAFAKRTLSGKNTGIRTSNAYRVVVNDQPVHTIFQFQDIPVELSELNDALHVANGRQPPHFFI
jgi:hypothetical protein